MRLRVLMLSTATLWLGTARMPRALAKAGFDVFLLAPPDSLASKSRYVTRTFFLPANAIPMEWLVALMGVIEQVGPDLLIPCDEMTIRLLFALTLDPSPGLPEAAHERLTTLIRASLGDPAFYRTSVDKTLLPPAAEALGVRMPTWRLIGNVSEARAFAVEHGYPVVLKRRFGFAGHGVAIAGADELVGGVDRLLRPDQLDLGAHTEPRLLIQAFVEGTHMAQALVARDGRVLASFAWERYQSTEAIAGQTAVVRFVESPKTKASSEALATAFGIGGFFNLQYIVDARTGDANLLEINRRIVTHMHMGERVGADLALALYRDISGRTLASGPDGVVPGRVAAAMGSTVAVFPREWLRDRDSPNLRNGPVDVPWDDPALFEALLGL